MTHTCTPKASPSARGLHPTKSKAEIMILPYSIIEKKNPIKHAYYVQNLSASNITFNLFQDKNKSVSAYQQFPVHQGVWLRQVGLELTSHTAARPAMHTEQGWRQAGTAQHEADTGRAEPRRGAAKSHP